jgi:hypothetical protein
MRHDRQYPQLAGNPDALSEAPPSRRAFYDTLLTHGDMLAVRVKYLPGSLLWLVTTPTHARLMRQIHNPDADVEATIMSLRETRDLLTVVGDAEPATVYEAAACLLAPPPVESQSSESA